MGKRTRGDILASVADYVGQLRQIVATLEQDTDDVGRLSGDLDRLQVRIGFLVDRAQEHLLRQDQTICATSLSPSLDLLARSR